MELNINVPREKERTITSEPRQSQSLENGYNNENIVIDSEFKISHYSI